MTNETMVKFGYPHSLIREYDHWVVLLRPAQVTLGSLVLAAKSNAIAFGDLPADAHAELAIVTKAIEATLKDAIGYERINYLMLMMVDPNVHFHVFPRYLGMRTMDDITIEDVAWPGPPDLKSAPSLDAKALKSVQNRLVENWLSDC